MEGARLKGRLRSMAVLLKLSSFHHAGPPFNGLTRQIVSQFEIRVRTAQRKSNDLTQSR